jgi:hypothetical protein
MIDAVGISQHTLEMMVVGAIVIGILGVVFVLYWKQIAIGCLALFTLAVMANHVPKEKVKPVEVINEVEVQKVEPPKVEDPVVTKEEAKPDTDQKYFMEDCLAFTDYSKKQCEAIWQTREVEEQNLLDVQNVEYKKRRAAALKKPGAFVAHYVFR